MQKNNNNNNNNNKKNKVSVGLTPSRHCEGGPGPWWLQKSLLILAYRHITQTSAPVFIMLSSPSTFVCSFLSHTRTLSLDLEPTLILHGLIFILTLIRATKTLVLNTITF